MYPCQQLEHHHIPARYTIFNFFGQTHLAYPHSDGTCLYYWKTVWSWILVSCILTRINDAESSSWSFSNQTQNSIWVSSWHQTRLQTWFKLFSIGYFNHTIDNTESQSRLQAHTLDDIVVGRDEKLNAFIFYNPLTSSYYCPPYFCLNKYRLPVTNFPKYLWFDGRLTLGLLHNKTDPIHEPFPPSTRVSVEHNGSIIWG